MSQPSDREATSLEYRPVLEELTLEHVWETVKAIYGVIEAQQKINEAIVRQEAGLDRMVERFAQEFDGEFWCGLGNKVRRAYRGEPDE